MVSSYLLILESAFTRGGLGRHRHSSLPRHGRRHPRLAGPVQAHQILSLLCVAEESRFGAGFQTCLNRGWPRLQLTSSLPATRAGLCELNKPEESSLHEQCRYTCKVGATPQFHLCRVQWMLPLPKTANISSSAARTGHV